MPIRQQALGLWLKEHCHLSDYSLQPLAGDASFRRYFRIHHPKGTYVAMDAPPDKESCGSFIVIAKVLKEMGLQAPEIFYSDLTQGFLLLSDFGDDIYLKTLQQDNAEKLYGNALDALAVMQACKLSSLSVFSEQFMRQELELFKEWFLQNYLRLRLSAHDENLLNSNFAFLTQTSVAQPQVFMHRDYHSANLMVLPQNKVGILDFQDAFIGPVTYDLVSLLRDCYISWPEDFVYKMVLQYRDKINLNVSDAEFIRWFDVMGMQRHLKALLTFSRKFCRDNNKNYLQHIPRTMNYLVQISQRYSETQFLQQFLTGLDVCVE